MGAWLHVDGAMAGSAAVHPDHRWVNDGLERADSYAFNPHKWLFTNFDCDAFFVADRGPLLEALSILPEYLRNAATDEGSVIDYRDWHVPLGRRFRALKLWFVLRHYGAEGLRHHVDRHVQLAQGLVGGGRGRRPVAAGGPGAAQPGVPAPRRRRRGARWPSSRRSTGRVSSTSPTPGSTDRAVIRVSIGQTHTEQRHVDALWAHLQALA